MGPRTDLLNARQIILNQCAEPRKHIDSVTLLQKVYRILHENRPLSGGIYRCAEFMSFVGAVIAEI